MTDSRESPQIEADKAEEGDFYVVDPDDYQQTRRLKQIDQAKKRVRDVRNRRTELDKREYRFEFAHAVAYYGSELIPLIDEAIDQGIIDEDDLDLFRLDAPDGKQTVDVYYFVKMDGCVKPETRGGGFDSEKKRYVAMQVPNTMQVYQRLNRTVRALGLGLEFEQDKGPAQI